MTIKELEKKAKLGKTNDGRKKDGWCFEHVVFYMQEIMKLPLNEVNRLMHEWDM